MATTADFLDDPLVGHPRYRRIKDLNEGTFGIVLLALDARTNEQV
jgi:serine/threonine-protein kinase SRK2